jgi:hypothetical protein
MRPSWGFIFNAITEALTSITSDMASKAFRLSDTDAFFEKKYTSD